MTMKLKKAAFAFLISQVVGFFFNQCDLPTQFLWLLVPLVKCASTAPTVTHIFLFKWFFFPLQI